MTKTEKVKQFLIKNPKATNNEIKKELEVSKRTIGRARKQMPLIAPKILLLDIETSPMEFLGWGLFKQQPSIDNIVKEWAILS